MPSNHPAVAALPTTGSADKVLLRDLLVASLAIVLPNSADPTELVAVDPDTGAAVIVIIYLGRNFLFDPTDTTTANDGVTCLVSNEGRRYKLSDQSSVFAYSVLDNTIATPPVSPSIGDAYLVAAGATGAWAGFSNYIAYRSIRGWEFENFGIGRFIYVESVDTYYHRNSSGTWVTGFGAQTTAANSIPLSAAINFGKRLIVENQTTTSPPGSPTVGTAYIIGAGATGGWSGDDLKIAICEVAGSFVIYNPGNGWEAYDKARNTEFIFNGTAWASAAGAIIGTVTNNLSGATNRTGTYSSSSLPGSSTGDGLVSQTYTMKSVTNRLRVRFSGSVAGSTSGANIVVAFFLNSNANTMAASILAVPSAGGFVPAFLEFEFVPGTTSAITISVRAGCNVGSYLSALAVPRFKDWRLREQNSPLSHNPRSSVACAATRSFMQML
jgi:hypothetical protein